MTQRQTNKSSPSTSRRGQASEASDAPRTVAVVHEVSVGGGGGGVGQGIAMNVAIGQIAPDARAASTPAGTRLTATRRFLPGDTGSLRAFLKESGVELVIRIVPASETINRLALLPDGAMTGDRVALADALSLMTETELPAQLPWYRRTAGVTKVGGKSMALLVGWHRPSSATGSAISTGAADPLHEASSGLPQLWTVEAVALAAMLHSPPDPSTTAVSTVSWIASSSTTAQNGAVSILAVGSLGARVRSLRCDGADLRTWLSEAIDETTDGLSEPPSSMVDVFAGGRQPASLMMSANLRPVVAGEQRDLDWLNQFGIAAATLDVFGDPDPTVRSLFNLHTIEPRERTNPIQRLITMLASPARAAMVMIACLALILGARLGIAYARNDALTKRVGDTTKLEERLAFDEQQVAFYATLKDKRWPMTKLLADIAGATPVGIELELLEINQGEPITIRGTAESNELVSTFRENLGKTRIFDSVTTPNIGSSQGAVQFQLQARPTNAGVVYVSAPIDDFAKEPLGKRIYGATWTADESGGGTDLPTNAQRDGRASSNSEGSKLSDFDVPPRTGRTNSAASPASGADKVSTANSLPALTDADIALMDKNTAMKEFGRRRKAAAEASDKTIKARLTSEAEKCKQRMLEAGKAASAGGAS